MRRLIAENYKQKVAKVKETPPIIPLNRETLCCIHSCLFHAPCRGIPATQRKPYFVQFCKLLFPTQSVGGKFSTFVKTNFKPISSISFQESSVNVSMMFRWTGEWAAPHALSLLDCCQVYPREQVSGQGFAYLPPQTPSAQHRVGTTTHSDPENASRLA